MKICNSHMTDIYINLEKRSGLLTQPYHMYILVNSGDLRIKLDLYYMRTCVSFIMANTEISKVNITLQRETVSCKVLIGPLQGGVNG